MMEPVEFPAAVERIDKKEWAIYADGEDDDKLICSILLEPLELEEHNRMLQRKYAEMQQEVRFEDYYRDDAEIVLVGYGVVSRVLQSAVDELRAEGLKVGMLRPITLFPFPGKHIAELAEQAGKFLVVELSNGQMVDDVRLAVNGKKPVHFYGRMGGVVPSVEEIVDNIKKLEA